MIQAIRRWWIDRQIGISEFEMAYWQSGMDEAGRRFNDYAEKKKAAEKRGYLLRQDLTELRFPTKHLKGLTQ